MSNSRISRIAGRVVQNMHLIWHGHILNPVWNSREERRRKRYKATLSSAMGYLERYADDVKKMTPRPPQNPANEPERAFTIWYQGEENAPELVKACIRSMRRHLDMEVVVIDKDTLSDWIQLPDYVMEKWKKGMISHTAFSDICRVELLYQHGGLWFDATDFVTAPVPRYIMDCDVFIFLAGNKIRGAYAFIQSCFIRARKGNPLLGIWREAIFRYWRDEDSKIDYFIHHLLLLLSVRNNEIAAREIERMPHVAQDPTHALWGPHCADPYDPTLFTSLTKDSFFQKTSYKDKRLNSLPPNSIAEFIILQ